VPGGKHTQLTDYVVEVDCWDAGAWWQKTCRAQNSGLNWTLKKWEFLEDKGQGLRYH